MAAVQSVVTPQAPIKSAPHAAASLDTEALFGETVTVDECENGFSHVVLGTDGYRGWMPTACLGGMPDVTHQVIVPHSYVTAGAARSDLTTRRTRALAKSATYIVPSGGI